VENLHVTAMANVTSLDKQPAGDVNFTDAVRTAIGCKEFFDPGSVDNAFQFTILTYCLIGVASLGILGNILSILILSRPQMKSSISAVLLGLAGCDTLLIVTSILLFSLTTVYPYTGYLRSYYYFWYPKMSTFLYPLAMTAQTASNYLTITVSFERFLVVYFPLQSRRWLNYERARTYIILILLFSIVFNLPHIFDSKIEADIHPQFGQIYCIVVSDLRANKIYIDFYVHWMYLIFNGFIPFASLSFFNIMIYRRIRRANKERMQLSRSEKREISLAVMLMGVVIVFLICNVLALILNIMEAFYSTIDENLNAVSNLLVTINSSVNFLVYVIFGEKFKRIFCQMFCKNRMAKRDNALQDDSTYSGENSGRSSGRAGYQRGSFIRSYKAQKRPTSMHGSMKKHYMAQNSLERGTTEPMATHKWTLGN